MKIQNRLSQQKVQAKKDPKDHAATTFATQLAQAQALVPQMPLPHVKPMTPHAHHKKTELPKLTVAAQGPKAPELPSAPTKESSAQPQTLFILPETPRDATATKVEAPPPAWAPKEMLADDTARLTLNPNTVNFITEGQHLNLQIKNGEVSIRAQGELAAALKSSESELRLALAQSGLKLRESDGAQQQQNDDASSDHHRREQQHQHTEREDAWT